jgi:two-component system, chemotaxis family, sensor kinase CheA
VAERAHALEDALDRLRTEGVAPDAAAVDALLVLLDALQQATAVSLEVTRGSAVPVAARSGLPAAVPHARAGGAPPADPAPPEALGSIAGAVSVRVTLDPDAALPAARALLAVRAAAQVAELVGTTPAAFDPVAFAGSFRLHFRPPADAAAIDAAIRSAGDVVAVEFAGAAPQSVMAPRADAAPGRVGHVRVELRRLDALAEAIAELSITHARGRSSGAAAPDAAADRMGRLVAQVQSDILTLRMEPLSDVFDRLPRLVRDTARQLGREVELEVTGADIRLDRAILGEIAEPLVHLIRNALDHGIEPPGARVAAGKPARGRLVVRAERARSSVVIVVEDDGAGVDAGRVLARARAAGLTADERTIGTAGELLRLLSHAGFSTADAVSGVSGRGVGLDAVATRVRALGGAIDLQTEAGRFTRFLLRLPITLALAQALRVTVGGEEYAIPLTHVAEAIEFVDVPVERRGEREVVAVRGVEVPVVRLSTVLGTPAPERERAAVLAESGERRVALAVDTLIGREQILIRGFDPAMGALPYFSGATLLADGRPVLVLDPLSVL